MDRAEYSAPIRQHELDRTDQEYISPEISRSSSGIGDLTDLWKSVETQDDRLRRRPPVTQHGEPREMYATRAAW